MAISNGSCGRETWPTACRPGPACRKPSAGKSSAICAPFNNGFQDESLIAGGTCVHYRRHSEIPCVDPRQPFSVARPPVHDPRGRLYERTVRLRLAHASRAGGPSFQLRRLLDSPAAAAPVSRPGSCRLPHRRRCTALATGSQPPDAGLSVRPVGSSSSTRKWNCALRTEMSPSALPRWFFIMCSHMRSITKARSWPCAARWGILPRIPT